MNKNNRKIFCIGFHKTGTKSLALSLKQLGYTVKGRFGINDKDINSLAFTKAKKFINKFDAFQDNPWPLLYKELDILAPNSKFILTIRNKESWLSSVINYFGDTETEMRKWIYGAGSPIGNEDLYVERYDLHNNSVLNYFLKRKSDLLVMNLEEGSSWNELCSFLKIHTIPNISFPHENKKNDETTY